MSLTQEQLDKLVRIACGYLYQDRINPDVGMGLFIETALTCAEKDIFEAARLWGSNKNLVVSPEEREIAYKRIQEWKHKNNI